MMTSSFDNIINGLISVVKRMKYELTNAKYAACGSLNTTLAARRASNNSGGVVWVVRPSVDVVVCLPPERPHFDIIPIERSW